MNYELAKQLKDAGFKPISFGVMELPDGTKVTFNERFPTLSELIEACGNRFKALNYRQDALDKWMAEGDLELCFTFGSTPEAAIANLWLKLNVTT